MAQRLFRGCWLAGRSLTGLSLAASEERGHLPVGKQRLANLLPAASRVASACQWPLPAQPVDHFGHIPREIARECTTGRGRGRGLEPLPRKLSLATCGWHRQYMLAPLPLPIDLLDQSGRGVQQH